MNKNSKIFFWVVFTLFVFTIIPGIIMVGIVEQKIYEKAPSEVLELAEATIHRYEDNNIDEVLESFVDEVRLQDDIEYTLESVTNFFDEMGKMSEVSIIGYRGTYSPDSESHIANYEILFGEMALQCQVSVVMEDGAYKLYRTDFNYLDAPLRVTNAFTFKGKRIIHILFLLLYIVITLLTFYSAALCYGNTKKHKWLRALFILIGFGSVSLNWATGEMWGNYLSVNIPTASIVKSGSLAPYIISLRFPLGVVFYWSKWRKEEFEVIKQTEDGTLDKEDEKLIHYDSINVEEDVIAGEEVNDDEFSGEVDNDQDDDYHPKIQ